MSKTFGIFAGLCSMGMLLSYSLARLARWSKHLNADDVSDFHMFFFIVGCMLFFVFVVFVTYLIADLIHWYRRYPGKPF